MNSQAARFFLYEKWFKSWKKAEKKGKIKRKKLQKIFCLDASTCRDEMPLIKVAYFMLNFLNLKSFLSNLFFAVASSLSTLWIIRCVIYLLSIVPKYVEHVAGVACVIDVELENRITKGTTLSSQKSVYSDTL